mmetsp:Transcript_58793/g.140145  ORF Transcript_58793/g.140145 Transcript_58793/m.140145 type:complete len:487 (+) Transcript_58793:67-1527(+)
MSGPNGNQSATLSVSSARGKNMRMGSTDASFDKSVSILRLRDETRKARHQQIATGTRPGSAAELAAIPSVGADPGADSTSTSSNWHGLMHIVFLHPLSTLLIAWPFGIYAYLHSWSPIAVFVLSFLALVPLAKILGDATEELAAGLKNPVVGGLLNATFGNAVEMILTVQSLRAGQIEVVKGTLLGSILSNLLLVLGMSFFIGGLTPAYKGSSVKGKEQVFSTPAALTNMTMLFLATCSFSLPTVFFSARQLEGLHNFFEFNDDRLLVSQNEPLVLQISRYCSIYILSAYLAFLVFQLFTHAEVFAEQEDTDDDGDGEEFILSPCVAVLLLCLTTIFVAASSECLVDSIDGLVEDVGIGHVFIGVILLPIVGNACEHAGAVRMAIHNKVDITIGIAIGSSTQVGLFVVPFTVIVGWLIDQPMNLNFGPLDSSVLMFAVIITFSIVSDGASNWLEGFMLMMAYLVIATLYWHVPDAVTEAKPHHHHA